MKLSSEQNVEECDATGLHSSTIVWYIKNQNYTAQFCTNLRNCLNLIVKISHEVFFTT